MTVHDQVDECALAMLHLSAEQREECFNEAFAHVLAKHPDMTEPPPDIVNYVAAVFRRIAELERQHPPGHA